MEKSIAFVEEKNVPHPRLKEVYPNEGSTEQLYDSIRNETSDWNPYNLSPGRKTFQVYLSVSY